MGLKGIVSMGQTSRWPGEGDGVCSFLSIQLVKQVLLSEVCVPPTKQEFSNDIFAQTKCVCVKT